MNRLTQLEVDNFVAAIKREPFNRPRFINTHRKLITCSGIRPDGVCDDMRIPRLLSEWRRDPAWALRFVETHQKASDAAWRMYWASMAAMTPNTN
jgi:hypothetical protein